MICRAPAYPLVELITPTEPPTEILALGLLKLVWFKTFCPAAISVNRKRSRIGIVLPNVRSCVWRPGPSRIFTPLFPKRPRGGRAKTETSNHRLMFLSPEGRFPFWIRSGNPLVVCVLDGSEP